MVSEEVRSAKRIDLHTHSACSDGTDTPTELMLAASQADLDVVALTDHDTTVGWEEASRAVPASQVTLVRGMEMSCSSAGITVHLLSYLHRPEDEILNDYISRSRQSRATRAQEMVERISQDYAISWEDILKFAPEADAPIGRPHIADALVAAGFFPDRSAVFQKILNPRSPYYVHHWAPDPVSAVQAVRAAGGVPVIAHPRAHLRQKVLPVEIIVQMAEVGLFALERDHSDHDQSAREEVDKIASRLGLVITGSSDYHGTGKPNLLGENLTSPAVFEEIVKQGALPLVQP